MVAGACPSLSVTYMANDPRELLRAWVPHLALLGLALAAGWWLLLVIAPVGDALMLAAALAVITYPVLFLPIDRGLTAVFGSWQVDNRRYLSALTATAVLGGLMVGFVLMLLVAVVGDLAGTLRLVIGVAIQDPVRINEVIDLLMTRVASVSSLMPGLHLDLPKIRLSLADTLSEVSVGS